MSLSSLLDLDFLQETRAAHQQETLPGTTSSGLPPSTTTHQAQPPSNHAHASAAMSNAVTLMHEIKHMDLSLQPTPQHTKAFH